MDRFDVLADRVPEAMPEAHRQHAVDRGIVIFVRFGHRLLASTQTGRLRWYAAAMVFGTVLALAMGVWR